MFKHTPQVQNVYIIFSKYNNSKNLEIYSINPLKWKPILQSFRKTDNSGQTTVFSSYLLKNLVKWSIYINTSESSMNASFRKWLNLIPIFTWKRNHELCFLVNKNIGGNWQDLKWNVWSFHHMGCRKFGPLEKKTTTLEIRLANFSCTMINSWIWKGQHQESLEEKSKNRVAPRETIETAEKIGLSFR